MEALRSELLPLAEEEADIQPAGMIVDALYSYVIPNLNMGLYNRSHYWENKGIDTAELPLQEVLDWVHSEYYAFFPYIDIDEYRSAFMRVYEVLSSYTDLMVGHEWLDSIWRDRVLAA